MVGKPGAAGGSMNRAFPWLELDDDRKTTLPMGKMVGLRTGCSVRWLRAGHDLWLVAMIDVTFRAQLVTVATGELPFVTLNKAFA